MRRWTVQRDARINQLHQLPEGPGSKRPRGRHCTRCDPGEFAEEGCLAARVRRWTVQRDARIKQLHSLSERSFQLSGFRRDERWPVIGDGATSRPLRHWDIQGKEPENASCPRADPNVPGEDELHHVIGEFADNQGVSLQRRLDYSATPG